MQGWIDLAGLVTYQGGIPAGRQSPISVLNSQESGSGLKKDEGSSLKCHDTVGLLGDERDLVTLEGCKAELTKLVWLYTEVVYLPEDSHPSQY